MDCVVNRIVRHYKKIRLDQKKSVSVPKKKYLYDDLSQSFKKGRILGLFRRSDFMPLKNIQAPDSSRISNLEDWNSQKFAISVPGNQDICTKAYLLFFSSSSPIWNIGYNL
jgi:hypothetical protein